MVWLLCIIGLLLTCILVVLVVLARTYVKDRVLDPLADPRRIAGVAVFRHGEETYVFVALQDGGCYLRRLVDLENMPVPGRFVGNLWGANTFRPGEQRS